MAEDLLAVTLTAAAGGLGTVARPMVDLGIDFYLRRRRSLLTIPVQVKSFRTLTPDGTGSLDLPAEAVGAHPDGYLAIVHLPEPYGILYGRLFLIPFVEFRRRCPRVVSNGKAVYQFAANFAEDGRDQWSDFAIDVGRLPAWLDAIPGWAKSVPPVSEPLAEAYDPRVTSWRSDLGRLWAAAEIERAAGPGVVVIAEDRIRLDTVTLLVHHLATQRIAGLHIRTGKITRIGTVHFQVKRPSFFVDDKLYVLLLLIVEDDRPHDFCLLIPSADVPKLGFSETVTMKRRLTKRFLPYQLPSDQLGAVFLNKVFGS